MTEMQASLMSVIPAHAGIHPLLTVRQTKMDSRFRGNDGIRRASSKVVTVDVCRADKGMKTSAPLSVRAELVEV